MQAGRVLFGSQWPSGTTYESKIEGECGVLVVNSGSSSVKLRVVDDDNHITDKPTSGRQDPT